MLGSWLGLQFPTGYEVGRECILSHESEFTATGIWQLTSRPSYEEFRDDDRLYLDDLQIGQRFTSGTHVVDEEQIKAFARQFDPQPFHLDNEAAKNTLLSGLAASGWHTAAITMRLLVESGMPLAGGIVGAGGELDWPNPTRPGDSLQVESEVLDIRPSRSRPDRGVAVVRSLTRNQRNEVVQCLTAKLIVPRRV
jgi:acyl dehydratase